MTPEALLAMAVPAILGWMGFTWRRAEAALERAERVADKVDRVELKMAEEYLTKKDFSEGLAQVMYSLKEVKGGMQYLTERVDFHVTEQAGEAKQLREEIERLLG
tara:strand:- start:1677 stop:1991 length:315 start_codon:yes stop_codon:yes gene_type:complete